MTKAFFFFFSLRCEKGRATFPEDGRRIRLTFFPREKDALFFFSLPQAQITFPFCIPSKRFVTTMLFSPQNEGVLPPLFSSGETI